MGGLHNFSTNFHVRLGRLLLCASTQAKALARFEMTDTYRALTRRTDRECQPAALEKQTTTRAPHVIFQEQVHKLYSPLPWEIRQSPRKRHT